MDIKAKIEEIVKKIKGDKKLLVLVGTKKAVAYAVKHITVTKRNTRLKERLQKN